MREDSFSLKMFKPQEVNMRIGRPLWFVCLFAWLVASAPITGQNSFLSPHQDHVLFVPGLIQRFSRNPQFVGHLGGEMNTVAISGTLAFMGMGAYLTVIDASIPISPTQIGHVMPSSGLVQDVALAGDYAYVASAWAGLYVISIATPTAPLVVGHAPGNAVNVTVVGDYAYVAAGDDGLRVISVANPTAPGEVGIFDTLGNAIGVAGGGQNAYVTAGRGGFRIPHHADPAGPGESGAILSLIKN